MPKKSDKPDNSKRNKMRNWIKSMGVPPGKVNQLIKDEATYGEIEIEVTKWLKDRPKKRTQ